MHHHGAEIGRVGHAVAGNIHDNAAMLADIEIGLDKVIVILGLDRVDDHSPFNVEVEFGGLGPNLLLPPQQGDIGDPTTENDVGGVENALAHALGQHDVLPVARRLLH